MRSRNRRISSCALAFGAALTLSVSACAGQQPPGDPGNKRLHQLAADPVFGALPPGAAPTGAVERRPAQRRQPAFDGGANEGPSVVVSFSSDRPPAEVYGFYADRAASTGWQPLKAGYLGLTDIWQRNYASGVTASLALYPSEPLTAAAAPRTWQLIGNMPAKR